MSMFRRPTDSSSESDTESNSTSLQEEDDDIHNGSSVLSHASSEEAFGPELATTETLSSGGDVSIDVDPDVGAIQNTDHHRNMMLASLLEDFYKSRAAELFNAATPGARYHRQSPEIQPLAQNLFAQASQDLANAGVIPTSTATDSLRSARQQYLIGFNNLGLQNLQGNSLVPETIQRRISYDKNIGPLVRADGRQDDFISSLVAAPMQELATRSASLGLLSNPRNDLQLSTFNIGRSHYQSSFRETRLLGKGGFGRVYQSFNYFDQREYAVKKIPLSPRLSQRYRERGHTELHQILREVQALAQLDHCNVVRYHATWIEEPTVVDDGSSALRAAPRPILNGRLLEDKPASSSNLPIDDVLASKANSDFEDGVVFAADSNASNGATHNLGWSQQPDSRQLDQSSLASSALFTDGAFRRSSEDKVANNPHCYVLHVQMSMYPITLAQYLQPVPSGFQRDPSPSIRRHCYHLVPSLKILLGILAGVRYVHARGLIHRDIKPSNIFLAVDDRSATDAAAHGSYDVGSCNSCKNAQSCLINPRIGDFGLVADLAHKPNSFTEDHSHSLDAMVGTQYYRPASRTVKGSSKLSHVIDEKLDVFAMGVILTEMLCQCYTSMQRLDLLKGLQNHQLPGELGTLLQKEGYDLHTVDLVTDLISGMVDRDLNSRWTCANVKEQVEKILSTCISPTEANIPIDDVALVSNLNIS